jgi:hypothetical protein
VPRSKHRKRSGSGKGNTNKLKPISQVKSKPNYWYIGASATIAILVIGGFAIGPIAGVMAPDPLPSFVGEYGKYKNGIGISHQVMMDNGQPTSKHLDDGVKVIYNTTPASSGNHWNRPSDCGWSYNRRDDERLVHNLEHGQIVVNYNFGKDHTADDSEEALKSYLESHELFEMWGVATWNGDIPVGSMAMAAWGVTDTFQGIQEFKISTFFEAYSGRLGPEFPYGLPCSGSAGSMNK